MASWSVAPRDPLPIQKEYIQSATTVAPKLLKQLHPKNVANGFYDKLENPLKVSMAVVRQVFE